MAEQVVIERRFRGPSDSANGGYACGLVAGFVDGPVVEATLRVPPPLDHPLEVVRHGGGIVELRDSDQLVAEARAVDALDLQLPTPPSFSEAQAAGDACPWVDSHAYPECFACGPARQPPDGLRNLTGPLPDREVVADGWTPHASLADADGIVDAPVVWAALDCPTGNALWFHERFARGTLLGRLTAQLLRPVRAGRRYIVMGWLRGHEGRKHWGASAIVDEEGEIAGKAVGLWIELRPDRAGA